MLKNVFKMLFLIVLTSCGLVSKTPVTESAGPPPIFASAHPVLYAGESADFAWTPLSGAPTPAFDVDISADPSLVLQDVGSVGVHSTGAWTATYTAPSFITKAQRLPIRITAGNSVDEEFVYLLPAGYSGYTLASDDKGPYASPVATVFGIPSTLQLLPDFGTLSSVSAALVKELNIPNQTPDGNGAGFGGLTKLQSNFAIQTDGTITLPKAGSYSFQLQSQDGSSLEINHQMIVDNNGQGSLSKSGNATFSAGNYPFTLKFFHLTGNDQLQLEWEEPGDTSFSIVPSTQLSH